MRKSFKFERDGLRRILWVDQGMETEFYKIKWNLQWYTKLFINFDELNRNQNFVFKNFKSFQSSIWLGLASHILSHMYQHEPLDKTEIIINQIEPLELHILSLLSFPHHRTTFFLQNSGTKKNRERSEKLMIQIVNVSFRLFKHNSNVKSQVHLWNKFQTRKLQAGAKWN